MLYGITLCGRIVVKKWENIEQKDGLIMGHIEIEKKSMVWRILFSLLVPLLLIEILILLVAVKDMRSGITNEVKENLRTMTRMVQTTYEQAYHGKIHFEGRLMKVGSTPILDDIVLDRMTEKNEVDFTIFSDDERVYTTLRDSEGKRKVGTKASSIVKQKVLVDGEEYYTEYVDVAGERYFGYYVPMKYEGQVQGMIFAGKVCKTVNQNMNVFVKKITITIIFTFIALAMIIVFVQRRVVTNIGKVSSYMKNIANGDYSIELEERLLTRKDEIGDMARQTVQLKNSLQGIAFTDPLTGLSNRRACLYDFKKWHKKYRFDKHVYFSIAMGDIDFFKKVNDTYGHDCGDIVLKEISNIIRNELDADCIVSRWGGEEFLLICKERQSIMHKKLAHIMKKLHDTTFTYNNMKFSVTMTFGLVQVDNDLDIEANIKRADKYLYKGKDSGRNRIYCDLDEKEESH